MTCLRKTLNAFIALALCSFAKDAPAINTLKHIPENSRSSYLWNISDSDSDTRAKNKRKEFNRSDSSEKNKKSKSGPNHSASSASHSGSDSSDSESSLAHSSGSEETEKDNSSDEDFKPTIGRHFSSIGVKNTNENRRDHNHETITNSINQVNPLIKHFNDKPTSQNLESLLQKIADIANIAYNEGRVGHNPGTWKHTLCKEYMHHIKTKHKNTPLDNIEAEYLTKDKKSRFDIVWLPKTTNNQKIAYVFDYKFGDENKNKSSPKDTHQYQQSLDKEGYTLVGQIRDIKPTNNS